MGNVVGVFEEKTVLEQRAYEEYKRLDAENFHLKKQLANKNKDIKRLKHEVRMWKNRHDDLAGKKKKDHYRNESRAQRKSRGKI